MYSIQQGHVTTSVQCWDLFLHGYEETSSRNGGLQQELFS